MSETTGGKRSIEELEAAVLRSLDRYFEACRGEVEDSKGRAGAGFKKYEEAQRQLADAEQELEELRHRTAALKAEALDAVTGGSEASDLKEGISELQEEADVLAKAEEAEERLWLAQQNFDGGPRKGRRRSRRHRAARSGGDRRLQRPTGPAFCGG